MSSPHANNSKSSLLLAAFAAFWTYFCMYGFRKPFTAATFEGEEVFGLKLKALLVISQLVGYMLSKFIGIRVVSEIHPNRRAVAIIGLIAAAELVLVGFAFLPMPLKPLMLFLNGLPLGMIFGLVLSYLEGRQQTEALSAALCASFIISSGVVKSVGQWLMLDIGVKDYHMPMWAGLIFFPPLLFSVWLLKRTPLQDACDLATRQVRTVMNREQRLRFFAAYWPGLSLLLFVYVALTIIRTIRDDFGVEIWRDMGITQEPSVYASTETVVAIFVTFANAFAICFTHHLTAIRITMGLMCAAFSLVGLSAVLQGSGLLTPFAFMVACGVGMYVPYVAFHTTIFERLISASQHPGNLVFLMYLADSLGYLGYAGVMVFRAVQKTSHGVLPFFRVVMCLVAVLSIVSLLSALYYFRRALADQQVPELGLENPADEDIITPAILEQGS